jgi:hypothetical protein
MTWIASKTERTVTFNAPLSVVFSVLVDVERSGLLFPGTARIEKLAEGLFHFKLEERSTAGLKFHGDYVMRQAHNGVDEVSWTPVSGNVRASGRWKLKETAGGVEGHGTFENEIDAPIPAALHAVVKALDSLVHDFAQKETERGTDTYVAALRKLVESSK